SGGAAQAATILEEQRLRPLAPVAQRLLEQREHPHAGIRSGRVLARRPDGRLPQGAAVNDVGAVLARLRHDPESVRAPAAAAEATPDQEETLTSRGRSWPPPPHTAA